MQTFKIYELQNLQSHRTPTIYKGTLQGAKSKATKEQIFQSTILKIEDSAGNVVAVKNLDGWDN